MSPTDQLHPEHTEPCPGILTWEDGDKRYWSPCGCEAGQALEVELRKAEADIRAGRLHKWSDIRRSLSKSGGSGGEAR